MRRFRDIIEDIKAPSTQSLWLNNGELKVYNTLLGQLRACGILIP
jgi:hypothetical protein